jgi:hypothetical protein
MIGIACLTIASLIQHAILPLQCPVLPSRLEARLIAAALEYRSFTNAGRISSKVDEFENRWYKHYKRCVFDREATSLTEIRSGWMSGVSNE